MEREVYSIEQTAKILNVHSVTIRRYIKEGKILAKKVGGRWNISSSAIKDFLAKSVNVKKCNDNVKDFIEDFNLQDKNISVCSIINVKSEKPEGLIPLCNELIETINSEDISRKWVNFQYVFLENEGVGRFTIYSNPRFMEKLLNIIGKYE